MTRSLKIAILRTSDANDSSLKTSILAIEGVRVVAELSIADDIDTVLGQARPDLLVVCMGESPAHLLLGQVADVSKRVRDMQVVLAGLVRDPDLLLTAMRAGVREFVQLPTKPEALLEILEQVLEAQPSRQSGRLFVVHGSGGGSGASTVACNLATEIARSGAGRVALIDLDPHYGQLSAMLDLFPTYSFLDLCHSEADEVDPARLDSALMKHDSGVRLLARPKELTADDESSLHRMPAIIHGLQDLYDYVIVDMDMRFDITDGRVLSLADEFFLVTQPVVNSIRNASQVIAWLGAHQFDVDRLRLVVNRIPKRAGSVQRDGIEKRLERNVFWEIPEEYDVVSESINLGVPLCEHATSSKVRSSIRDLAVALSRPAKDAKAGGGGGGLLSRIFSSNVA